MSGFNEPLETPYENGRVMADEPREFTSEDEKFEEVDRLVDSGVANYQEARDRVGYDSNDYAEVAQKLIALEEAPDEVGIAERVVTVQQRFGFIPRGRKELSDTYDLTGKDLVGGAATHLNTVLNRQMKYMEEPDRTVRSIVSRYADYAKNARAEFGLLKQLQELIEDEKGAIATSRLGAEWQHSGALARPLMHLLWSRDVNAYVQEEQKTGNDPLKALEGDKYKLSNRTTIADLQAYLSKAPKSAIREVLHQSINDEQSRFDFWVKALQESRNHLAGRPIAYGALVELGVIEKQ